MRNGDREHRLGAPSFEAFYDRLKAENGNVELATLGGARLIGSRPDGSYPVHVFYRPLEIGYVSALQQSLRRPVPAAFAQFLSCADGARLYRGGLRVFGYPVYRDTAGQPIDLRFGNVVERPIGMPESAFVIGSYAVSYAANAYLYLLPDGCVGSTPTGTFVQSVVTEGLYEALLQVRSAICDSGK